MGYAHCGNCGNMRKDLGNKCMFKSKRDKKVVIITGDLQNQGCGDWKEIKEADQKNETSEK
jgi:hypothetical protein